MNIKNLKARTFKLGDHKSWLLNVVTGLAPYSSLITGLGKRERARAINNFYSNGYANYFMRTHTQLYMDFHKISPASDEGQALIALQIAQKVKAK